MEMLCGICSLQESFFRRSGTGKQTQFSFCSIPSGRTAGERIPPGAEEKQSYQSSSWACPEDVSPCPASAVGNTWIHAHGVSAATEMFSLMMALSRNEDS